VLQILVQAKLIIELVANVDGARIEADDLAATARQVDHAAIADDELGLLPVGKDVGMAEAVAGLKAKLCGLDNSAQKTFRLALAEGRNLAQLGKSNPGHALGGHVAWEGRRDLALEAGILQPLRGGLRFRDGGGFAGGDCFEGLSAHGFMSPISR